MLSIAFIFRIIFAAIALLFLSQSFLKFIKRQRSQTFFKFFTNVIIWAGIFFISLMPNLTHNISEKLGFGENLNTFIFMGFVIVFMILFKIISIIERTERNISEIVRKEALRKLEK